MEIPLSKYCGEAARQDKFVIICLFTFYCPTELCSISSDDILIIDTWWYLFIHLLIQINFQFIYGKVQSKKKCGKFHTFWICHNAQA